MLLGDGGWHDRDQIIVQLLHLVPPGRALRVAERERLRQIGLRQEGEPPPRRVERSQEFVIRSGARTLVRQSLQQICDSRVEGGRTFVRLRSAVREAKEDHLWVT